MKDLKSIVNHLNQVKASNVKSAGIDLNQSEYQALMVECQGKIAKTIKAQLGFSLDIFVNNMSNGINVFCDWS